MQESAQQHREQMAPQETSSYTTARLGLLNGEEEKKVTLKITL